MEIGARTALDEGRIMLYYRHIDGVNLGFELARIRLGLGGKFEARRH